MSRCHRPSTDVQDYGYCSGGSEENLEGEQVLQDVEESVFSSDTDDIFLIETDKEVEGKPNENGSDDVHGSTTTLEDRR